MSDEKKPIDWTKPLMIASPAMSWWTKGSKFKVHYIGISKFDPNLHLVEVEVTPPAELAPYVTVLRCNSQGKGILLGTQIVENEQFRWDKPFRRKDGRACRLVCNNFDRFGYGKYVVAVKEPGGEYIQYYNEEGNHLPGPGYTSSTSLENYDE